MCSCLCSWFTCFPQSKLNLSHVFHADQEGGTFLCCRLWEDWWRCQGKFPIFNQWNGIRPQHCRCIRWWKTVIEPQSVGQEFPHISLIHLRLCMTPEWRIKRPMLPPGSPSCLREAYLTCEKVRRAFCFPLLRCHCHINPPPTPRHALFSC